MLRKSFLIIAALVAAFQSQAAPVDVTTAKATAKQYLVNQMYAGKIMAPSATEPTLILTEKGDVNKETPVFYIFNTSTTYLIVSGDDRAEEVLAVGDQPLNLERIPDGLKYLMDCYKEQLDWLISHPNVQVEKISKFRADGGKAVTYGPLLTSKWDQMAPYWNQCKFTYNGTTYQCLTGCPATSAAMVMHFWKWPTAQVAEVPSYSNTLEISTWNTPTFTYPSLPATTFDWNNMKDSYLSYNTAQANAVATLMRYVGQAEKMSYGTMNAGGSGILTTQTQNIVNMFTRFGYDSSTCRVAKKTTYSETNWANLIKTEMAEGRPIVFMGVDNSEGGHAFNVDGYRDSDNKYHINFGWSGDGNNWYAMNAFTYDGATFNQSQQVVIGIKPTADYFGPMITTSETALTMEGIVGQPTTSTFTVTGNNLTSNITLTVNGSGYSVDPTTITPSEATLGKTVTVTYNPTAPGTHNGTITLKSTGATNQTVSLAGSAKYGVDAPVLAEASNISGTGFTATWTHNTNANVNVTYTLDVRRNGQTVSGFPKTGITAKTYNVTGLTQDQTYTFRVKAVPTNTSTANESDWSNNQTVTLTVAAVPTINSSAAILDFGTLNVGQNGTQSFTITGTNLEGNITAALTDANGVFALNTTSITPAQAANGKAITVTFTPNANQMYSGSVKLTSANAQDVTVALTGNGAYVVPVMQAANETYININKFRAEWTDETPADKVASYTLEVNYVAPEPQGPDSILVVDCNLDNVTTATDDQGYLINVASNYSNYLPEGWTIGNHLYTGDGYILIREQTSSNNFLKSPTFTLPEGYDKITVEVIAAGYNNNIETGLTVATGSNANAGQTIMFDELSTWYRCIYVLNANSTDYITLNPYTTSSNYWAYTYIGGINVYAGDLTEDVNAPKLGSIVESGDDTYRLITGITNKYYDVTGLIDEGTYNYKVKAIYTNGSESEWSNIEEVTLFANQTWLRGDVNGDGEVDVRDITALIDVIMNSVTDNPRADVNEDGEIDVRDITALIDIIMNS